MSGGGAVDTIQTCVCGCLVTDGRHLKIHPLRRIVASTIVFRADTI